MSAQLNVVRIAAGLLSGTASADGVVRSFKGIPFAAPPLRELRWRAPQRVPSWSGIRSADRFAPRCVQRSRPETSISYFGPERESEDCLYLNVWTAAGADSEKRPVMVWFHGGAFNIGSASLPIFDGENLARAGIVLVTVNYRLGRLGFLAHPELSAESEHGVSGNYGLLDQITALEWVRDNIAAFGGDASCVTIFGQSAGSSSVACLMASPLAKGLFHRAIGQSGGSFSPPGRSGGGSMRRLGEAEGFGKEFADRLGANSIAELRSMSADDIQLRLPEGTPDRPWPIIDRRVIPDDLYSIFSRGEQHDVPLLTGSNADEGATRAPLETSQELRARTRREVGANADALVEAYIEDAQGRVDDASRRLGGHITFTWQNWTWARLHARSGASPTYYYRCGLISPLPDDLKCFENAPQKLGTFHTAEIPYVFRNLDARKWPWRDADRDLSNAMSTYWINFAASGNPNGRQLPTWTPFDPDEPQTMNFGTEVAMGRIPEAKELDWLDRLHADATSAVATGT